MVYGILIGNYHFFPYSYLKSIQQEGKFIISDLLERGDRFISQYDEYEAQNFKKVSHPDFNKTAFSLVRAENEYPGFRVIVGTFNFQTPTHAALLLDPNNEIRHTWQVHEDFVDSPAKKGPPNKFPHGFVVLPDGSIIFAWSVSGVSIQRFDICSKPIWATNGNFHHSISFTDDHSAVWTLLNLHNSLALIDTKTGNQIQTISYEDIMKANPDIDIFGIRQLDIESHPQWTNDKFHDNDVEPLPENISQAFPMFSAGDLLVSLRSLNLILVLDPNSLKIKWWRMGLTRRQHDPDWQSDGTISVFDNNMHREYSRILKINPQTFKANVLFDGKMANFYTWRRGKHQILENGNILITIPDQGRVIEVDENGKVVFEFLNKFGEPKGQQLLVSEAIWLPKDYFDFKEAPKCQS